MSSPSRQAHGHCSFCFPRVQFEGWVVVQLRHFLNPHDYHYFTSLPPPSYIYIIAHFPPASAPAPAPDPDHLPYSFHAPGLTLDLSLVSAPSPGPSFDPAHYSARNSAVNIITVEFSAEL